jgi:hypothetical protein
MVQADLLLARVYAGWGGHTNDALKVYDSLIAEYPDDFRGYLAKVGAIQTPSLSLRRRQSCRWRGDGEYGALMRGCAYVRRGQREGSGGTEIVMV